MARNGFEDALDNCTGMVDKGLPVEECLLTYPEYAARLDGPLQAVQALRSARVQVIVPPPAMRRGEFLSAVAEHARTATAAPAPVAPVAAPPMRTSPTEPRRPLFAPLQRLAMVPYALPAALAVLVLGGAAWGVSAATGTPGPGSWLGGGARMERMEVRGTIAAISPDSITVATSNGDVTAAINGSTELQGADDAPAAIGDFAVGDAVKLSATRGPDGALIAREIELEDADDNRDDAFDGPAPTAGPRDDNRGPGNAEDEPEDNRGPGNAEDEPEDNRGPGNAEDEPEDNRGPGNAEDTPGIGNGADEQDDRRDRPNEDDGHGSGSSPGEDAEDSGHQGSAGEGEDRPAS